MKKLITIAIITIVAITSIFAIEPLNKFSSTWKQEGTADTVDVFGDIIEKGDTYYVSSSVSFFAPTVKIDFLISDNHLFIRTSSDLGKKIYFQYKTAGGSKVSIYLSSSTLNGDIVYGLSFYNSSKILRDFLTSCDVYITTSEDRVLHIGTVQITEDILTAAGFCANDWSFYNSLDQDYTYTIERRPNGSTTSIVDQVGTIHAGEYIYFEQEEGYEWTIKLYNMSERFLDSMLMSSDSKIVVVEGGYEGTTLTSAAWM